MPMTVTPPYMQMGEQRELSSGMGMGMGYIPNFVQDYLTAKGEVQKQQANKAAMDDYTQSQAVDNAYASKDPAAIANVKKQYPAKAAQYESMQQTLQDKRTAAQLDVSTKKMGAFQKLLQITPDLQSYNDKKSQFASFTDDGKVPSFTSDEDFQKYRSTANQSIGKAKAHATGALGYYQLMNDTSQDQSTRDGARTLWSQSQEEAKLKIDKMHTDLNNAVGKDSKLSKEGSPTDNDLNSVQALIASNPNLSGLPADVPADSKKGTPYQIKDQGIARNWIAQNTNDIIHQSPKMNRGDAARASASEAELMVDTDKDGNKTFNSDAQVATVNGQYVRVLSDLNPKNGYKVRDSSGKIFWYKPKGFKPS